MLKRLVNECRFNLVIQTEGPVLIKQSTISNPDMKPVQTYRNGKTEVYLPGSSLKGVFRSHIERVIRTLNDGVVCNPFVKMEDRRVEKQTHGVVCSDYADVSCGDKFEIRQKDEFHHRDGFRRRRSKEDLSNKHIYHIYRDSCPICRLFGSTSFIGRVAISDAYLTEGSQKRIEQRDNVGIDRFTSGAANGAKFDLEVVSSGVMFETSIHMRNFEVWQLGMLMLIVQDLEDGLIRIGSGRSRGLGSITGKISEVLVNYIGVVNGKPADGVWGLGKLLGDNSYGTDTSDQFIVQPTTEKTSGIRKITTFSDDSLKCLKQAAVEAFVNKIQSWKVQKTMQFEYLQFQQIGGEE